MRLSFTDDLILLIIESMKYDAETEFLSDRRSLILDGIEYIEDNVFRQNFLTAMEEMKWKCVIVPDSDWIPSKFFPTETSEDSRETRIIKSYISKNPSMFGYSDKYGWAYHELVHVAIFSGNFPQRFLALESPFEYPLNTDEIYCYGYQIKHLMQDGKNGNLMRFAIGKIPYIKPKLCLLRNALFK
jgi:hypothetical protein